MRPTPTDYERVYDYDGFVEFITLNGLPDFISFDYDLGIGRTGYDCAKFLVEYCLDNDITKINYTVSSVVYFVSECHYF